MKGDLLSPGFIAASSLRSGELWELDGDARGGEEEAVDVIADFGGELLELGECGS